MVFSKIVPCEVSTSFPCVCLGYFLDLYTGTAYFQFIPQLDLIVFINYHHHHHHRRRHRRRRRRRRRRRWCRCRYHRRHPSIVIEA